MPLITPAAVTNPATSAPLTGAIVLSKSQGGCNDGGVCTIVTYTNGLQTSAYSYSPYGQPLALSLPVFVPLGTLYYNMVAGDPTLIACDPSKLCGKMPYEKTIDGDIPASDFSTLTPISPPPTAALQAQITTLTQQLATANTALTVCQSQNTLLKAKIPAALGGGAAATTDPLLTAKLISSLDTSCPPPPPPAKTPTPSIGCCGEVDSVAGFIDAAKR